MASIGSVSSNSSAWAAAAESRASAMRQKMFSKVDSDASGSVDATELQSMLDDIAQKTGSTELGAFETKLASAFSEALQAMQAASASSSSSSQSGDSSSSDSSVQSAVAATSSASQAAAQERVAQAYRQPPPDRSMTDQAAINAFA